MCRLFATLKWQTAAVVVGDHRMHSSIAAVTFYTPSYQIAHTQEKECNMNTTNTRRGFTQTKNAVNKNQCHSRGMLSGIYNACYCKNHVMLNSFQHLHLTQTCDKKEEILNQVQDDNSIKEEALNKGSFRAPLRSGFTRPSSSRSVSMRDIGADPCGFTQNVIICPPCGESVAGATKEGQNRKNALWPLLPRLSAVLPPQGREMNSGFTPRSVTPQCRYAGYSGRRGFTLIELLVVVLIIGILAAVAVPQYQKAVEKSRATQALALLKPIAQAVESYYLANGEGPTSFTDLDVEVPAWTGTTGWLKNSLASDTISNEDWSLQIVRSNGSLYIGRISGPYAGVGFAYFPQAPDSVVLPPQKILCAERTFSGIRFTKQTGDYCQKVMGLSNHYDGGAVQWFD